MTAAIINGNQVAAALRADVERGTAVFNATHGRPPGVAVIRAGDDPGALYYGRTLERMFGKVHMGFRIEALSGDVASSQFLDAVERLNVDPRVDGIILLEPLPDHIDKAAVKRALLPEKDVDGIHPLNTGRLAQAAPAGRDADETPYFVPATPAGGLAILAHYDVPIAGRHAVVVGRSTIVGKPMALLLLQQNATVTICHSRTTDLAAVCRTADLLCSAVGSAHLIRGDWIKPGAFVLDFGVNFVNGEIVGDVAFDEAKEVAGMITPVPGGTGPVTNAMLMRNVLRAAEQLARDRQP